MATSLLDMLVEAGLINSEQFEEALRNCMLSGGIISTSLLELGLIEEGDLARFLSRRLAIPFFDPLPLTDISHEILNLVTPEVAVKYRILPLNRDRQGISLAMADPSDLAAVEDLASLIGAAIQPLAAPEVRLLHALKKYYGCSLSARDQRLIDKCAEREIPSLTVLVEPLGADEELEEAEVIDELEDLEQGPELRLSEVAYALSEARDRQEVASILFCHLRRQFEVMALFLVRNTEVSGWKAVFQGKDVQGFDLFSIPLSRPSVLKTVVEGKIHYLGEVDDSPLNDEMLKGIGSSGTKTILLLPLLLEGRVVNILYVEGDREELAERVSGLRQLQEMAGLAFRILILKSKLLRF
jgi:hypothetical protein